ncbi:MAG TPA: hypothetical protein VJ853_11900 [Thermoanaerobaculia bacterium]|nr:hypothetical protein [Thermoanaerobaculia bacterium]
MSLADRQLAIWLALLTFATYAYFQAGGGWNQNSQFDLTRAIVEQRTFAIDAYASNTGDVSHANGHIYSNKSPALSWIAAIPYALLRLGGVDANQIWGLEVSVYVCTLLCIALPGAFIAWMLYRYARQRGFSARWSATIALTASLATQLLPYSTIFMLHVTSGALLLFALTSSRDALSGFAAALATAMNYICAPALVIIGLTRPRKLRYGAGAIAPLILLAMYQRICFGSFFALSVAKEHERFLTKNAAFGLFTLPTREALWGISFSPYRGLFYFAPVLITFIAGAIFWLVDRRDRIELGAIVLIFIIFFVINSSFNGWEGGFGIGARYLVPAIPLLMLVVLRCRGWMRPVVVALAIVSFAINFAATAVDPQPSGTIPRPLSQYIVPLLIDGRFSPDVPITPPWSAATFTGHTSVNRLTFDEAIVFSRHPPASPPSEWTSFNLGEPFFGAGDARSLIPIALLLLLGGAAIGWKARSIPRSSESTR